MAKKSSIIQAKYDKKNITQISLKLHTTKDKDIIEAIDHGNKQGSIKKLIRRGLNNDKR